MLIADKYRISITSGQEDHSSLKDFEGGVVLSASWEIRSQDLASQLNFQKVEKVLLLVYKNKGKSGISGNIRNKIKSDAKKHGVTLEELEIDSVATDFASHSDLVANMAATMSAGPLRWAIDISSMPRRVWTALIFLLDKLDRVRFLDFFYSHPKYLLSEDQYKKVFYKYTGGEWTLSDVPFAQINFNNGLLRRNIISVGFEYDNLKRIIYEHEEDQNSIIYASPGFTQHYTDIADQTADRIRKTFEIDEGDVNAVGVCDFSSAYSTARKIVLDSAKAGYDVNIICAGNKLHSLAMTYVKVAEPLSNFLVRVPKSYRENSTPSLGKFDLISTENILAPY
ncbi:MAG: hypothetical protein ABL893_14355 [Hyphomicrobium sp.]